MKQHSVEPIKSVKSDNVVDTTFVAVNAQTITLGNTGLHACGETLVMPDAPALHGRSELRTKEKIKTAIQETNQSTMIADDAVGTLDSKANDCRVSNASLINEKYKQTSKKPHRECHA